MNLREVTVFNEKEKIKKLVLPGFDGVPINQINMGISEPEPLHFSR
jgi:hypothetical protein